MTAALQPIDQSHFHKDIANLNQTYLMLCRDMAANNPEMARISLGLPTSVIEILANLTLTELGSIVQNCDSVLMFQSRFGTEFWTDVVGHTTSNRRNKVKSDLETKLYVLGRAAASAPS